MRTIAIISQIRLCDLLEETKEMVYSIVKDPTEYTFYQKGSKGNKISLDFLFDAYLPGGNIIEIMPLADKEGHMLPETLVGIRITSF